MKAIIISNNFGHNDMDIQTSLKCFIKMNKVNYLVLNTDESMVKVLQQWWKVTKKG